MDTKEDKGCSEMKSYKYFIQESSIFLLKSKSVKGGMVTMFASCLGYSK